MIYGLPEKQPGREISVLNRVIAGSAAAFAISASTLTISDSAQFKPDCEEFVNEASEDNTAICANGTFGFGFESSNHAAAALITLSGSVFFGVTALSRRQEIIRQQHSRG